MAFGSPSINTPNALDLRALQTAIANTRARIEQLEQASGLSSTTVQQASAASNTQFQTLLNQLTALAARVTALEALTFTSVDDVNLTLAQRSFAVPAPPAVAASAPIDVSDASLQIAVASFQRAAAPQQSTTIVNDSVSILATQIFGA